MDLDGKTLTFEGKGKPEECSRLLEQLIYKPTEPWQCNPKPCVIGTTYQPTINELKMFYVMGAFLYPLNAMKVLKSDGKFSLTDLKNSAKQFCSKVRVSLLSLINVCTQQIRMETCQTVHNKLINIFINMLCTVWHRVLSLQSS